MKGIFPHVEFFAAVVRSTKVRSRARVKELQPDAKAADVKVYIFVVLKRNYIPIVGNVKAFHVQDLQNSQKHGRNMVKI